MKKMKNEKMKNRFDNDSPNKAFFLTDKLIIFQYVAMLMPFRHRTTVPPEMFQPLF